MAAKKRSAKKAPEGRPAKRPARPVRKNDDPVWSTSNPKSSMVHEDLHGKFCNPKTYENWTRENWEEARRDCLPEDVPYNEDGYSVPLEYFKYNLDWRRFVREFQEDLEAGRYEPEWQKQALQASRERSEGKFDKWKEDEFEEFWGQKQKTPWHDLAGESANIRLEELAKHQYIREGDIFSYARVFGKGKNRTLIEKDVKVVKIEGSIFTMAIPPGQLKYARHLPTPHNTPTKLTTSKRLSTKDEMPTVGSVSVQGSPQEPPVQRDGLEEQSQGGAETENAVMENAVMENAVMENAVMENAVMENAVMENAVMENAVMENAVIGATNGVPYPSPEKEDSQQAKTRESVGAVEPSPGHNSDPHKDQNTAAAEDVHEPTHEQVQMKKSPRSFEEPAEDVLLTPITTLSELEKRIIEVDGRVDKSTRVVNAWKAMRGKRNNQDLGSLFEMREEFYVWQSPKIVKTPQTTRSGRESRKKVNYHE